MLQFLTTKQNRLDAVALLTMRFACKAAGVLATSGKSNSLYKRKEDTK